MKEKAFTIFDSKSEIYARPMYAATTEAGQRLFHSAVNQEGSQYGKYGGDYTLFEIGEWNDNKGEIVMHKAHQNLGTALTYLDQVEPTSNQQAAVFNMQEHTRKQLEQSNEELEARISELTSQMEMKNS